MHEKVLSILREHAMKIVNFKNQKLKLLTKEQQESYANAKLCYICKEKLENENLKDKKYYKLGIIIIMQENLKVLHIAYVI